MDLKKSSCGNPRIDPTESLLAFASPHEKMSKPGATSAAKLTMGQNVICPAA
jgi:hypothetical protein